MPKLCNIDLANCQKIRRKLRTFVRRLKKQFPVKEVYLFGTWAKGEVHEGSDIDLLIIGNLKGRIFQRIEFVSSQVKVYHLANAKVYHPPIGLLNG